MFVIPKALVFFSQINTMDVIGLIEVEKYCI